MAQGKETMRDGVRGHIVHVAPKEGYDRFVPVSYDTGRQKKKR